MISQNGSHSGVTRRVLGGFISHFFKLPNTARTLDLLHVQHGADAVALLHGFKGVVDLGQRLTVGDELVDLEPALEVVGDEVGQLAAALDAAEGAALPDATSDQLECYNTHVR